MFGLNLLCNACLLARVNHGEGPARDKIPPSPSFTTIRKKNFNTKAEEKNFPNLADLAGPRTNSRVEAAQAEERKLRTLRKYIRRRGAHGLNKTTTNRTTQARSPLNDLEVSSRTQSEQ